MKAVLAFLAGWLLRGRVRGRASFDEIDASVSCAVRQAMAVQAAPAVHRGEQQFIAGVALGIFGNAAISVIADLVGPGIVAPLLLAVVAILALAYADTALRGASVAIAVYEAGVLAFVAMSVFLSIAVGLQLAGMACAECLPAGALLVASIGYAAAAMVLFVVSWLARRLLG